MNVDNYECYKLVDELIGYDVTLNNRMDLTIHYKIFKNVDNADNRCISVDEDKFCVNDLNGTFNKKIAMETQK